MKKQKLAFIIPSLKAGGAERVVSTLANQLIHDFEITIVVLYKCTPFYPLDDRIQLLFIKDVYLAQQSILKSIMNNISLVSTIYKHLKKLNIDMLIGFTTTANMYTVMVARRLKIPCIISERIHPEYGSISKMWNKIRKFLYPKANVLVVQTQAIKDYFKAFMSVDRITIINNPLAPELTQLRKQAFAKTKTIINVGRLTDQKNQELLIRAFANTDFSSWQLVIVGDGEHRKKYTAIIEELALTDHVKLVGNVTNVADYYNEANIFALTSNYEGFPNALIEAMYFGLACISSNCPSGPSNIINNGKNGLLFPVNDQLQLENKLSTLMANADLRDQLGQQALQSVIHFEADKIGKEWALLIAKTIA